MYILKPKGRYVQVLNLNTGSVVSSIDTTGYKGYNGMFVQNDKIIIQCGDGKTRVFKPSGTLVSTV